ncbi:ribonuclease III [Cytophagales bacterium LB-30]|uniref:Ribonuclease 3 n=1 Tax=Shiella aurantiaca TaxID=3058365 RepID=A0ABT8F3L5_9BACT|nr:ribonuclease III [Shiella aurantiaca]MDN4164898.1 ribonuclease III [Shiella aurantiaca]
MLSFGILHHLFSDKKEKEFKKAIKSITGLSPFNLALYTLSTLHTSMGKEVKEGVKESNERLEYLGDAVLGTVVAEFLFKKYPFKDEGFLTDIRSRIVNRESLNQLAKKIGLRDIVTYDQTRNMPMNKSLYGDALEALVGAVYLDRGFAQCRKFILNKLIIPHFDLEELIKTNPNFKSKLIEWAQRENKEVRFEIISIKNNKHFKEFTAQVFIDDQELGKGHGLNKKKAEQDAAMRSCELLHIQ